MAPLAFTAASTPSVVWHATRYSGAERQPPSNFTATRTLGHALLKTVTGTPASDGGGDGDAPPPYAVCTAPEKEIANLGAAIVGVAVIDADFVIDAVVVGEEEKDAVAVVLGVPLDVVVSELVEVIVEVIDAVLVMEALELLVGVSVLLDVRLRSR
jgi:hypothetical protein